MKKIILTACLCVTLLFSLTACGKTPLEEEMDKNANFTKEEVAEKVTEGYYKACKADSTADEYAEGLMEIISLETVGKQKKFSNSLTGLNEMIDRDRQIYKRDPNDRYAAALNGTIHLIAPSDNNYTTALKTLSLSEADLEKINTNKEEWLLSEDETISGIAELSISFIDSEGNLVEIPVGSQIICVNGNWKVFSIALAK